MKTDLFNYGFTPTFLPEDATGIPARVTAVHRGRYELICGHGHVSGKLKSSVYFNQSGEEYPTTGDFVMIDYNGAIPVSEQILFVQKQYDYNKNGDSRIIKTLQRKTFLSRRDPTPGQGEQAIAANFDCVFIMQSLNRDFNLKRLERYLAIAWQSGAVPAVILTKADLIEDYNGQLKAAEKLAKKAGVYVISALTGQGLTELQDYLKPKKTLILLGSSGVGKAALGSGELLREHWESYLSLKRDASFSENKAEYLRKKSAKNQEVAMFSRKNKKGGIY
ncbi:MAG: GTPase RsgA [Oscillospiraceae bacterium]|nr:GTPase RsgA [Oscillospiraceae bacterium]